MRCNRNTYNSFAISELYNFIMTDEHNIQSNVLKNNKCLKKIKIL